MTDSTATRPSQPWLAALALAGYWIGVVRMLSPQWSVYVQYNFGWAVPSLCLYLLWLRWRDRPTPESREHPTPNESPEPPKGGTPSPLTHRVVPGLLLVLFAVLLLPTRIVVEANPIWRAASWAMAIELVGITLCVIYLAGGRSWLKHFGFPVVFFLFAIPWPSQWENELVQALMRANTSVVVEIISALGVPAVAHGNVIEIKAGLVGIDEACSGIRSLQATLMMAFFFGELYRLPAMRRVWLVLTGIGLALICNVARTFLLVWVCHKSGLQALERWHDPAGIAILLACFTGLWVTGRKLKGKSDVQTSTNAEAIGMPPVSRFVTATLLIWLVALEAGTAAWFGWREKADPQRANWSMRWPTTRMNLRDVELSRSVKQEMKFNEGRGISWSESDGTAWQLYYFGWGPASSLLERVHVQFAKGHRPEICLPATGLTLREDRGVRDFLIGNLTLPFRVYRFEDRGLPLHVYFCAWEDGTRGAPANMRESAATRLAAAYAGSRSVSQRVLEIAVWGQADTDKADAALQSELGELIEVEGNIQHQEHSP